MFPQERYEIILNILQTNKLVKVAELVEQFAVSIETVRRDLEYLEKEGLLKRVYGGAVLPVKTGAEPTYSVRSVRNLQEKIQIGKKTAELICDGDTLMIDIGTTALEVAKRLKDKKNLSVITNDFRIASELVEAEACKIYFMGGLVRKDGLTTSGFLTEQNLRKFNVDKAIIGVAGISPENGISDYHSEEAEARQLMIELSEKVIAVADYSKFGVKAFIQVCTLDKIQTIVTDWRADPEVVQNYEKVGVEVIVATP